MKRKKNWLKFKRYPHIGLPISTDNVGRLVGYVKNKEKIAQHAFFPLIHRKMVSYRTKGKGKDRKRSMKVRHICYATHLDAQIYSYYNEQLSKIYELKLRELNLGDVVVAYRAIPTDDNPDTNKSHIHFAKEAFDFIRGKIDEAESVSVVVSDISGFFDNLDHTLLKTRWMEVMGEDKLPEDVYNVYRNVTHFSYIDEWRILKERKNEVVIKNPKTKVIKTKTVRLKRHFRDNNVIAFCERNDISKLRHLITCRPFDCPKGPYKRLRKGIPQGLPISATLANVYMLHFDLAMKEYALQRNGLYRRYSDDIVLILPGLNTEEGERQLASEIRNVNLDIQKDKNKIRLFYKEDDKVKCLDNNLKDSKLEYLGFSFDGKNILLKSRSINHYYLKQSRAIEKSVGYARTIHNQTRGQLFENRLLRRFTRIGSRIHKSALSEDKKRMLEGQRRKSKNKGIKHRLKFGNFHSYVARAARIMKSEDIIKQLSHNLHRMRNLMGIAKEEVAKIPKFQKPIKCGNLSDS